MQTTITRRVALAVASAGAAALVFGATAVSAQGVIKIGTPLALTGPLADEGKKQKVAYDMWLKRVNAAGGIKVGNKRMKVQLIEYDYQTNGKRAQQVAEKLITSDKVNFLSAPFGSGHTKIVAAVAERYGVPLMASVSSSLSVYNQGFKNLFGTLAPNTGLTDAMFIQGCVRSTLFGRHAGPFLFAVADQVAEARLDLCHRLHRRSGARPQADG
jgi:branched-chain amino acid transport system substrate-binding protein